MAAPSESVPAALRPIGAGLSVLALGLVVWAITAEVRPDLGGPRPVGVLLLASLVAAQAALLSTDRDRAGSERARAESLARCNHLARELHDVHAHTLAALSLQLEALDVTVQTSTRGVDAEIVRQLEVTRRLAREGFAEARDAERALRDGLRPVPEVGS